MDIYVTEFHPFYQVWVDGQVYDTIRADRADRAVNRIHNVPLTWSQQTDIAEGYAEALRS